MRRYDEDDGIRTMSYGEPVIVTDLQVRLRPRQVAPVVELPSESPAERTAEYAPVVRGSRAEPVLLWWLICGIPIALALGYVLGLFGSAIYGAGAGAGA